MKEYTLSPQEKQELWRQKQIRILFNTGRPIFHKIDNFDDYYYHRIIEKKDREHNKKLGYHVHFNL
tara:strand:+ start:3737 stop:3934 length:198 start_codon:yes stop_codon:yes gene_type:complete